ncbi:MAG TPA: adenylate/guanylate cyclase domain-containing protein [Bacteroidota bacterium]|nr:adenylate/guanylate cyclase domain-containing protein [Bacteroidota bacterium]
MSNIPSLGFLRKLLAPTLRNKIYLLVVGLVGVLIYAVLTIVDRQVESQTMAKMEEDFQSNYRNFDRFLKLRNERLRESCLLISELPVLKANLETKDHATLKGYFLSNESPAQLVQIDILILTDARGRVLFRLDRPEMHGDTLAALHFIKRAMEGADPEPGEVISWVNDEKLFQISTFPIIQRGYVIGTMTIGNRLTQAEADQMKKDTQSEVTFLLGKRVVASTHSDIGQVDLLRAYLVDRDSVNAQIGREEETQREITLDGERFMCVFAKVSPSGDAVYVMGSSVDKALASLQVIERVILAVGALALIIALVGGFALARGITAPVQTLVDATEKIRAGNYDVQLASSSKDEIGKLSQSFNEMVIGLRERILMSKFVSVSTVEMIREGGKLQLGGERRNVTVFFSDIRGFTSFSERVQPEVVIDTLNKYLSMQARLVVKHHGVIDKYVGDELVAIFEGSEMVDNALLAATEIQKEIGKLNRDNPENIQIGIGINTGMAIVGNVGSEERMDHTVLGNNMNLGARLCSIAQPGQILISESSWRQAKVKEVSFKPLDAITVKGIARPVPIYEVQCQA